MGRYQDASFAGHSTASQLPEPIFPLNLIKIILPLRMMIQLESWYRVTEAAVELDVAVDRDDASDAT